MQFDRNATHTLIREFGTAHSREEEIGVRVSRLGAHALSPTSALFGFWTPELLEEGIPDESVHLELLTPSDPSFDPTLREQRVAMARETVPVVRDGEYTWSVVDGVVAGSRDRVGTFYRLRFTDAAGITRYVIDPLAASVPFGAAAPAELYDVPSLLARRRDHEHFRHRATVPDPDGIPRVTAPTTLLEVHTATATESGTLAGLTRHIKEIAERIDSDSPAADLALREYEAIQLMPIEPTILYEAGPDFWEDHDDGTVTVRRPDTTNWGYDVITVASPAPNPTLLESGRPDELLDLIEALHTFPSGPINVVFDIVYGHADNQTLSYLNHHFFAGANMYGQNLNYRHPVVRRILLEMQWRKSQYGVDGIRVDGAQDFTYWDSESERLYHDDEYLREMNDLVQEVGAVRYRPWMIFEDGRPWPRDDWELASTYREVTKKLPRVVQWGPLTFAHNTPFLFSFWIGKWWRIREVLEVGAHWITGASNHDTLRRGTQVPPDSLVNSYLGATLPDVFENGYDNAAARLFDAFVPGIPMDFLNANLRAPWSFMRNTDARWAIKVVSEETWFLDWTVRPERFVPEWAFPRLKALGFRSLDGLKQFIRALDGAVRTSRYDAEAIAEYLNALRPRLEGPPELTGESLREIVRGWMDDVHDFCNLDHYRHRVNSDPELVARRHYAAAVRRMRNRERWLAGNFTATDRFEYLHPTAGSVVFAGLRRRPDTVDSSDGPQPIGSFAPHSAWETLFFAANMEGAPRSVVPEELIHEFGGDAAAAWSPVVTTPSLAAAEQALTPDRRITLRNGEALLLGVRS